MIWRVLRHPNVLPLLGVVMNESQFVMASEWMPDGNINEFVRAHPDANRLELVCSSLGSPSFVVTEVYAVAVARGCHQGVNVLA